MIAERILALLSIAGGPLPATSCGTGCPFLLLLCILVIIGHEIICVLEKVYFSGLLSLPGTACGRSPLIPFLYLRLNLTLNVVQIVERVPVIARHRCSCLLVLLIR